MAKKLAQAVYVRNDDTGESVLFEAGSTPPAWAAQKIKNPAAWGDGADPVGGDEGAEAAPSKPRRRGRS